MNRSLVLAHDIGTSGTKSSLVTPAGVIVASASTPHTTCTPSPGRMAQDPESWWDGVCRNTRELMARNPELRAHIEGIGLSGHMLGCLPVDADGNALHSALIHSDSRAVAQCATVSERIGAADVYRRTGCILDPRSPLCKILWFQEHEPDIYQRTARFLQSKDYVAARLTGNLDTTDYSDASHAQVLHLERRDYDCEMLDAVGISVCKLPELHRSTDVIGRLTPGSAEALDLPAGIPVVAGGGDGSCASVGAGVGAPGDAYCCIGSTAWIAYVSEKPFIDDQQRIFNIMALDGETFGVFGTIQSAGSSLDYAMGVLGVSAFTEFEELVKSVPPGSQGLIFLPYLEGERSPIFDPLARGVFFGIQPRHTREHFLRATIEGAAYALRSIIEIMRAQAPLDELRIIGGGARSDTWRAILADVLAADLITLQAAPGEATSLGAAIAAGVGIGWYADLAAGTRSLEVLERREPDADASRQYRKYFPVYRNLYPQLKHSFADLALIEQEQ